MATIAYTGLPADDIPLRISELMRTSGDFSGIKYILGEFPLVPSQDYPLVEIMTEVESVEQQTMGTQLRNLVGFVRFSVLGQDTISYDDNNVATVASVRTLTGYINKFVLLFDSYITLNSLTFSRTGTDATVLRFLIDDTAIDYATLERPNNWENQGVVPWVCGVKEVRQ